VPFYGLSKNYQYTVLIFRVQVIIIFSWTVDLFGITDSLTAQCEMFPQNFVTSNSSCLILSRLAHRHALRNVTEHLNYFWTGKQFQPMWFSEFRMEYGLGCSAQR